MKNRFSVIAIAILLSATVMSGCSSSNDFEKGREQLEQQGYTDVKDTGYNFFCCDDKDTFSTGFECLDGRGNVVKGCFCSSLTKGVTIRFE